MADELISQLGKLDPSTLRRVLEEVEERESQKTEKLRSNEAVDMLQELWNRLMEAVEFEPGQLVRWKRGLKNRTLPAYGVPAVVIEVVDPPVYDDTKGSGSAYFREPLTLVLGILDDDEELVQFHFDGRRFELISDSAD